MTLRSLPIAMILLSSAAVASAQPSDRVSARVSVQGINLLTNAGMAQLESRLNRAARRACLERNPGAPRISAAAQSCINEMVADGMSQGRQIAIRGTGNRTVAAR